MKKFTAPKAIAPVTGTILSVETVEGSEGQFIALKLMQLDRSTVEFRVNPSWVAEFGLSSALFVGNIIVIEGQECLKGITGWTDDNGDEVGHTKDHLAVTAITPLIEQFMVEDGYADRVIDRIMIRRAELEAAALATTPVRAPRTQSNEGRIERLLAQYEASTNQDTKANIMIRLNDLGYVAPKAVAKK